MTWLTWMTRLIGTQNIEQIRLTSGHWGWFSLRCSIRINVIGLIGIVVLVDGLDRIVEAVGSKVLLMRMLVAEWEGHKPAIGWQWSFLFLWAISIEYYIVLMLLLLLLMVLLQMLLVLLLMLHLLVTLFGLLRLLKDAEATQRLRWLAIQSRIECSS